MPRLDGLVLQKTKFKYITADLNSSNLKDGVKAFKETCHKISILKGKIFQDNKEVWKNICNNISAKPSYFIENFNIYRVRKALENKIFLTGYYEIELNGSRKKKGKYIYPIYKSPRQELLNLSRKEIEDGALENKNLELLYVDDFAKLFFLHIQGSGKIKLEDGTTINVGFAAKNNQKYSSIGKYFIDEGIIKRENISALKIMDWLRSNPEEATKITEMNASYIFFEERENSATGSLGVPVTGEGSIAVDKKFIPLGMPVFLKTKLNNGEEFNNFVNAQDTGSAIKGALRADIFFGNGERAERLASGMKNHGELYLLAPKGINPRDYF